MSIHLLHKNTFRPGYIPQPHDLEVGQLGITIHTGEVALWTKDDAGNIVKLAGGGGSGMPVYDGMLTLERADGSVAGTFTANQRSDVSIKLPAGFSGDYQDLINKPDINDGKLTIKDSDGSVLGTFTANQELNSEVVLPAPPAATSDKTQVTYGAAFPNKPKTGAQHVMSETLYEYAFDGRYWIQIDSPAAGAGGGGGGSAGEIKVLNDLADVSLSQVAESDLLQQAGGRWINSGQLSGGDY